MKDPGPHHCARTAIFPRCVLGPLRLFRLEAGKYIECASANWMPEIGLGLTLWEGVFQDVEAEWLRFVDEEGRVIPTGGEKAHRECDRAERLAARLRELGEEMDEEPS